ncbi:MAG: hypothetical protein AAF634_03510 [Bacteroidota bacterium]
MRTIIWVILGGLLMSCQNDDNGAPLPPEFEISATIGDDYVGYEQTVFDGGSNGSVNVFNRANNTLLLQSFKNGKDDSDGFWTIRTYGVDIENLVLPYALTGAEASISWVDESIKKLQVPCAAPDVLCFYSGVGVDEVKITIEKIENNTISGTFEGKLYHIRINPTVIRDTNDITEVVDGAFTIKFQSV